MLLRSRSTRVPILITLSISELYTVGRRLQPVSACGCHTLGIPPLYLSLSLSDPRSSTPVRAGTALNKEYSFTMGVDGETVLSKL